MSFLVTVRNYASILKVPEWCACLIVALKIAFKADGIAALDLKPKPATRTTLPLVQIRLAAAMTSECVITKRYKMCFTFLVADVDDISVAVTLRDSTHTQFTVRIMSGVSSFLCSSTNLSVAVLLLSDFLIMAFSLSI